MSNCPKRNCHHEWCDRNRKKCDWPVPAETPGYARFCGEKTTWLAPLRGEGSDLFPMAFCQEHAPATGAEGHADA